MQPDEIIEPSENLQWDRRKSIWDKATYSTRKGISFIMYAMTRPEKWERAIAYAEHLEEQLSKRAIPRADQNLIEMFITEIYPLWYDGYIKTNRDYIKRAKEKYQSLPKADKDRLHANIGKSVSYEEDDETYIEMKKSHLDCVGVDYILAPEMKSMIDNLNKLANNQLYEAPKPKLLEGVADA